MKIENASPEITEAVKQIIARQMAEQLFCAGTDLARPDRVTAGLAEAGFGGKSIAALRDEAIRIARAMRQEAG